MPRGLCHTTSHDTEPARGRNKISRTGNCNIATPLTQLLIQRTIPDFFQMDNKSPFPFLCIPALLSATHSSLLSPFHVYRGLQTCQELCWEPGVPRWRSASGCSKKPRAMNALQSGSIVLLPKSGAAEGSSGCWILRQHPVSSLLWRG